MDKRRKAELAYSSSEVGSGPAGGNSLDGRDHAEEGSYPEGGNNGADHERGTSLVLKKSTISLRLPLAPAVPETGIR